MLITIVTTKNRPNELSGALESINNQTRVPDNVIVVSDSSEENYIKEKSLCDKFTYTLLRNESANNYPSSLNTAIKYFIKDKLNVLDEELFNDTYIAILDDDDTWDPKYLETCEDSLKNHEDFVVTGLIRKTDTETHEQSIPHDLSIDDFLKGNPHIQGSNTFVKLTTLLKAGLFDENMSSCNDRDIFIRIMMLKPTYVVVDAHLVTVNASDSKERITNSREAKLDGLKKFYYKYQDLMSEEVKKEFFLRNERYFGIYQYEIDNPYPEEWEYDRPLLTRDSITPLVVGFIASSFKLGLRLINELIDLHEDNMKVVILINFVGKDFKEYKQLLKSSGYKCQILTIHNIKREVIDNGVVPLEKKDVLDKRIISDISISRSILQYYLYKYSKDGDAIWILDDDMELKTLFLDEEEGPVFLPMTPVDDFISTYKTKCDVAVGQYTGGAPLPLLSTLRSSLVDYLYSSFVSKDERRYHPRPKGDYYYDLSIEKSSDLETPYYFESCTLDDIFNSRIITRPLYYDFHDDDRVNARGGNTLVFNRELLKIPNYSLTFGDGKVARRSDYLWVVKAKEKGYKVKKINLATYHNRGEVPFNYDKEIDKLLKDFVGAAFSHALENTSKDDKEKQAKRYNEFYINRLISYICSYIRIIGILQIVKDNKYSQYFNFKSLFRFTRTCLEYANYQKLEMDIKILDANYKNFANIWQFKQKFIDILENNFSLNGNLTQLGYGQEGIVFHDNNYVYKCFYQAPKDLDYLKSIIPLFKDSNLLYDVELFQCDNLIILLYPYEESTPYSGDHNDELIEFLSFLISEGIVFTNFKKENFVINSNNQLKLIDYGEGFEPLTDKLEERMCKRVYELISYPFLTTSEFKKLINLSYKEESLGLDYNVSNLKLLTIHRDKVDIHDLKIKELIDKYHPQSLFDYGAGRCAIINSYATRRDAGAYDIDQNTLNHYASNKVHTYKDIDEVKDDSYDLLTCNLVLCSVDNSMVDFILTNSARILKLGGHAIISVCNPFYNDIKHTEDRKDTECSSYQDAGHFVKESVKGNKREEYQRDVSSYINGLQRNGFEILNIYEIDGVNKDTLNRIGEFLVFECELKLKVKPMEDCSLLIKACPMDHQSVYEDVKDIVLSLEKGDKFKQRLLVLDLTSIEKRARVYDKDDTEHLLKEVARLKVNGFIDDYLKAEDSNKLVKKEYQKYFDLDCLDPHSKNGEPTYTTLVGFDYARRNSRYIYQTDCDMLIQNNCWGGVFNKLEQMKKQGSLTACFSCPRGKTLKPEFGDRVEVRSSFIDLDKLEDKLPLYNEVVSNTLQLSWYRSLDQSLEGNDSLRFRDTDIFIIHPENTIKKDTRLIPLVRNSLDSGFLPDSQYETITLDSNISSWEKETSNELVIYIRGKNTPIEKVKRLLDSIYSQSIKEYQIAYVDDGSTNGSKEYIKFMSQYDNRFKDKIILANNQFSVGALDNLVFCMQNIIKDPNAIVVNIDSDDALIGNDALAIIKAEFDKGYNLTCGNLFRTNKPLKHYKIESFKNLSEREGDNIWLHPKCFRRYLFDKVKDEDLKINGEYVSVCQDIALMLPMIEDNDKCEFIDKELYYYEPSDDVEYLKTGSHKQKEQIKEILLKRRKENGK